MIRNLNLKSQISITEMEYATSFFFSSIYLIIN